MPPERSATTVQVGFADETLHAVMGRLLRQGIGRFPVVAREDPRQIIGYLGRADILRARMRFYEEEEVRERFSVTSPRVVADALVGEAV